ncbi:hypothetical protein SOVF_156600 [Spinacia oleracea]|uniref:Uncharacterized protein isoform X2 n=1 Tax=Spinacia oleracea TaxID=3562 RepID=A0A9R0IQA4_SPIOL|nr:uncharacterized protein LOC110793051 isoform X2 [Spinacia oleracea]KNA09104.1 hypothetical protein SOVF_156600 [Spinacia oleracea]
MLHSYAVSVSSLTAYEDGSFCDKYHHDNDGWRHCDECDMQVHCGCIMGLNTYETNDTCGVTCKACLQESSVVSSVGGTSFLDDDTCSYMEMRIGIELLSDSATGNASPNPATGVTSADPSTGRTSPDPASGGVSDSASADCATEGASANPATGGAAAEPATGGATVDPAIRDTRSDPTSGGSSADPAKKDAPTDPAPSDPSTGDSPSNPTTGDTSEDFAFGNSADYHDST